MERREYVAALDPGTSKILAVVAGKNAEGKLSFLALEKIASGTGIRRGCIYNIEETTQKVSSLINSLNRKLYPRLKQIYVGIGGQSLRTECHTVKKEVNGESVDEEIINSLYEECKQYQPELAEILDIVSPEYYLDGRFEAKPKGVPCNVIEAKFQLILGRPSLKVCLEKSIREKANIEIAGFFISPIATAKAVLTDREKELGCALVEFGAGITYLSIYKGGLLKYMIAIPLGGNVITKDICSTNILESDAEEVKIKKGSALSESDREEPIDMIIEARTNEIIANIVEQIKLSGYGNSLGAGIIITGGASLLKNLNKSIHLQTNLPVREASINGSLIAFENSEDYDIAGDPANVCVVGLLLLGKENCAEEALVKERKEIRVENSLIDLFEVEPQEEIKKQKEVKRKDLEKKKSGGSFFTKFKRGVEDMSKGLFDDTDNSNSQE